MRKRSYFLLQELRIRIPFLQDIPDAIYFGLDTTEFYFPDDEISIAREELEKILNANVMTYKRDIFCDDLPANKHLCAWCKTLTLTPSQQSLLQEYEDRYKDKNINFCIYKKPLLFLKKTDNPIYHFFQKKSIISTSHDIKKYLYKRTAFDYITRANFWPMVCR